MGNQQSSNSSSKRRGNRKTQSTAEQAAERAKRVVGDLQEGIKNSVKKLDDDHPAAQLLDQVCGTYYQEDDRYRNSRSASYYSEDVSEDGSRTFQSEDDTTYDGRRGRKSDRSIDSRSYVTQSDYDSDSRRRGRDGSFDTEDESRITHETEPKLISKPLASSFAKRCYFTKSGIGKTTQHYEGLTLTGNVVLMLASAMKLKGCPTICDEDLRRVEQTYPNQFSRLPDELLLSSGWRRISKYCHFSNKPIPDGIPFFHSKKRLHPSGGYYFLLAASVGMIRPIDVEPLTKDTLVLLETDYPNQCDASPNVLIHDPLEWVLVDKFCFFSGGPINAEEDVYYQADLNGSPIFMLAFLSPSLTPEELYKLNETGADNARPKSVAEVQEVESVYDLTERDFDDLKLYHLGPCRALPHYILQPSAWTKVLPPHFLDARHQALLLAYDYDSMNEQQNLEKNKIDEGGYGGTFVRDEGTESDVLRSSLSHHPSGIEEPVVALNQEGTFNHWSSTNVAPTNETISGHTISNAEGHRYTHNLPHASRMDPPDDEPPSLKIESMEEKYSPKPISQPISQAKASTPNSHLYTQGLSSVNPSVVHRETFSEHASTDLYNTSLSRSPRDPCDAKRIDSPRSDQHSAELNNGENHLHDLMRGDEDELMNGGIIEAPKHDDEILLPDQERVNNFDIDDDVPFDSKLQETKASVLEPSVSDEKKDGVEKLDTNFVASLRKSSDEFPKSYISNDKVKSQPEDCIDTTLCNNIDAIDTSFTETNDNQTKSMRNSYSPSGTSTNSGRESRAHESPAMRGAHAILKRNRRRRAEGPRSVGSPIRDTKASPKKTSIAAGSEIRANSWKARETSGPPSVFSGSSVVTDNSGPSERSSRRQLILQMAKARMKSNRESSSRMSTPMHGNDEGADETVFSETNATLATHDFDLTGDLD